MPNRTIFSKGAIDSATCQSVSIACVTETPGGAGENISPALFGVDNYGYTTVLTTN